MSAEQRTKHRFADDDNEGTRYLIPILSSRLAIGGFIYCWRETRWAVRQISGTDFHLVMRVCLQRFDDAVKYNVLFLNPLMKLIFNTTGRFRQLRVFIAEKRRPSWQPYSTLIILYLGWVWRQSLANNLLKFLRRRGDLIIMALVSLSFGLSSRF